MTSATLGYFRNAFNAREGYPIAFNGTKGRLDHGIQEEVTVFGDGKTPGAVKPDGTFIRVFSVRTTAYEVELWPSGEGGHSGGDSVMLDDLFLPQRPADKCLRASDHRGEAYAILTGVAANHSFVTGKAVTVADLVQDLELPNYPAMPSNRSPVPMPPRA